MNPDLDLEARRLFVSTALTTHATRSLGGRISSGSDARYLLTLAHRLGEHADSVKLRYRLRFEPPYPGLTAGPEAVGSAFRLVLACRAFNDVQEPLGVAFTTLIPGRLPQVSVAPVEAAIPEGWLAPEDLSCS